MIDWTIALELREEMGAEDFEEVFNLFLSEVESALAELDNASTAADSWEASLHLLKGAALNLGFSDLAQLCSDGERAAASGDTTAVTPDAVRQSFFASRTLFLEELPQHIAA